MEDILDSSINTNEQPIPFDDESNNDFDLTDENLKKESKKFNSTQSFSQFEVFKIIVDTRKFEIENFWKRATFFWGTISILFAAYNGIKIDNKYLALISLVGFIFGIVFSLSLRGSKYWQENWEHLTSNYEKYLNNIKLFRWEAIKTIDEENEGELLSLKPRRVSVSKLVMILSDFLTLIWLGLLIKDSIYLIKSKEIFDNYKFTKYGCYFIGLVILISFYLLIFLYNTHKRNEKLRKQNRVEF